MEENKVNISLNEYKYLLTQSFKLKILVDNLFENASLCYKDLAFYPEKEIVYALFPENYTRILQKLNKEKEENENV
jgi:hypothetical protein